MTWKNMNRMITEIFRNQMIIIHKILMIKNMAKCLWVKKDVQKKKLKTEREDKNKNIIKISQTIFNLKILFLKIKQMIFREE